ncbi:hypothetical protein BZARG_818 [Bizionia argentinensis JUB59]|uniref:Beta-carotene 15,15'-monooxygenase n=1 Tax=Bizionia argentinensis JUB59 TaxID=1046627 RepID=G2EBD5_9FLAO|nr:hypothetical protein [Bizionia argentinensis]EGV44454.1 hypothetical protein BZARG_818 [Bizionia argentinensis JUB59]
MDELELLKKDWQKDSNAYPKLSYNDIYKMILKKSSSIVKWIFIISLLEFIFWIVLSIAFKGNKEMNQFDNLNSNYIVISLTVIGYIILAYFFFMFFKNYRTISVTDNAKKLMENILKTRQTVRRYVAFNLLYLIIACVLLLFIAFDQDKQLINLANIAAANGESFKFYAIFILTVSGLLAIVILILLIFYWLVYGILLRRLNRNYKELKKLDL